MHRGRVYLGAMPEKGDRFHKVIDFENFCYLNDQHLTSTRAKIHALKSFNQYLLYELVDLFWSIS